MILNAESRPHKVTATLRHIPRALRLVWSTHRGLTFALGATTLLQALIPAASAWVGKLVVDGVVQMIAEPSNVLSRLGPLVGLAFTVAFAGQALNSLSQMSQDLLRDLLAQRINTMIIEKAITLDLSHYETPAFYDMLQRAQQEASYRPLGMLQEIFSLARGAITLFSLVALLLRFSPWVVLVLVVTGLPALLVQSGYGRASFQMYSGRAPEWRQRLYLSLLLTAKHFVKEIKLFGLAQTLLDRYKRLCAKFYRENRALSIRRNLGSMALYRIVTDPTFATWMQEASEETLAAADPTLSEGEIRAVLSVLRGKADWADLGVPSQISLEDMPPWWPAQIRRPPLCELHR